MMATHHIYQLGELQFDLDGDGVGHVLDGPHQLVVAGEDLVVESLGVRIGLDQSRAVEWSGEEEREEEVTQHHNWRFRPSQWTSLSILFATISFSCSRINLKGMKLYLMFPARIISV